MKANGRFKWGADDTIVGRALRDAEFEGHPNDDLVEAVVKALKVFSGAKLRAACVDGGPTVDLILWLLSDRPITPRDRTWLAHFLAGELNSTGRPRTHGVVERAYAELLLEARVKRRALTKAHGTDDALIRAAKWASKDPRSAGKSWTTIQWDMGRKRLRTDQR